MGDQYVKINREPHGSCRLPEDLETTVWRYMNITKFKTFLNDSALYLCRVDKLRDRFEGNYSRRQIREMLEFLSIADTPDLVERELQDHAIDRKRRYVNCWCVSETDLDLMWKAYITDHPGVAVKSTVGNLISACDAAIDLWPLDISLVKYKDISGGERINSPGIDVYITKDKHFELDNELRIVQWGNWVSSTQDHILLPVCLTDVIKAVVLEPGSAGDTVREVRELLDGAGLKGIPLEFSRYDRDV